MQYSVIQDDKREEHHNPISGHNWVTYTPINSWSISGNITGRKFKSEQKAEEYAVFLNRHSQMFDVNKFTRTEKGLVAEASDLGLKPGEMLASFSCFNTHGPGRHSSFNYVAETRDVNGQVIEWAYQEWDGELKAFILND